MSSQTSLVAEQVRLRQWAAQIQECQSRPADMKVETWCSEHGITKANYYYRLRRVRKACLEACNPEPAFVEYQFIFAVPGNSCFQIIRDKIFRNCPIIRQCMYCTSNKMWELFIQKDLCINKTAKSKCSRKNVNFPKSASSCVQ